MEYISTFVTSMIAPKLGLDSMSTVALSKMVDSLVVNNKIKRGLNRVKYPLAAAGMLAYAAYRYKDLRLPLLRRSGDIVYDVYDPDAITTFSNLFKKYPEFFAVCSVDHGTYRNTGSNDSNWVLPSVNTKFCIPEGVFTGVVIQGTMCAMYTNTSQTQIRHTEDGDVKGTDRIDIEKLYIRVVLSGNIISYASLLNVAEKCIKINDNDTLRERVRLYGTTVFRSFLSGGASTENITTSILKIQRSVYSGISYFDEYFSPRKQELLEYCKLDQCNLLLYGPAGTGKSMLIHTMAMHTERHIISIDLSALTKKEAYQVMSRAYVKGKYRRPHEYIVVFEEFDNTINVLKQREQAKLLEEREVLLRGETEYARYKSNNISALKENKDDSQLLRTSDLLALFQSCVPRRGQMLIATTNHYEKIKVELPALFRPGRMTPILIDYADRKTVSEIILKYFPESIETAVLPRNHTIPTSQIIELSKLHRGNYDVFVECLNAALHSNTSLQSTNENTTVSDDTTQSKNENTVVSDDIIV